MNTLKSLSMAVVGHTNTGKTSMVRTLLRKSAFGEVKDQAGTTKEVSGAHLMINGRSAITIFDSPGLENAPGVFDWLDQHAVNYRHQSVKWLGALLQDPEACQKFKQECQVLELVKASDIAFYVCDAREPLLEKYQDELSLLACCGTPIIIVLNHVISEYAHPETWRQGLAALGQHHVLAFDAVVRDPVTEQRLFEKARSLLDEHIPTIDAWLTLRHQEEIDRLQTAVNAIADLLLDVAGRRWRAPKAEADQVSVDQLQNEVRAREQACVDLLLDLYQFEHKDYDPQPLTLKAGRWQDDLFDPQTMKAYGIETSRYVGAGAGLGAVFDMATGGLSLGTGTLTGAALGGVTSIIRRFGDKAWAHIQGEVVVKVDEATLRLLTWRQMALLRAVRRRGHASHQPINLSGQQLWSKQPCPSALKAVSKSERRRRTDLVTELLLAFSEEPHHSGKPISSAQS